MMRLQRGLSLFRAAMSAMFLAALSSGCLHHRCALPPEMMERCKDTPCSARHKVYVVMLHGFDPIDWDELDKLRNTLNDVGFIRTYRGHFYHVSQFATDITRRLKDEPGAQVVIVSTGWGVEPAHELAIKLHAQDVPVAAMMCLGAPFFAAQIYNAPEGVGQVVYLERKNYMSLGANESVELVNVESTDGVIASNPETVSTILTVLMAQTNAVPATEKPKSELAFADPIPTPKPIVVEQPTTSEWDYLRPLAKLPAPGSAVSQTWTTLKPKADEPAKKK
jgi:hypothetical protein